MEGSCKTNLARAFLRLDILNHHVRHYINTKKSIPISNTRILIRYLIHKEEKC